MQNDCSPKGHKKLAMSGKRRVDELRKTGLGEPLRKPIRALCGQVNPAMARRMQEAEKETVSC